MINLAYKGSRKYIHITDIYNSLFYDKNYKKLDILFKKKIKNQPKFISKNLIKDKKIIQKANCTISIIKKKIKHTILIYDSKKKINIKYHYDEKLFYKFFKLTNKSCRCNFGTEMSSIEVLIALTKYFHIKKIKNCSWLFSKLTLKSKLNEKKIKNFTIYLKKNYINMFTKLDIYQNKKFIGEIQFSN